MMKKIILLTIFIAFLALSEAKVIKDTITLTKLKKEGGFHYLSKMAMDIGSGSWSIRARYNKRVNSPQDQQQDTPLFSQLHIFLDDEWLAMDHDEVCTKKVAEARTHKSKKEIKIPNSGEWSKMKSGTVSQQRQRRVWFFVLGECEMSRIQSLLDANRHAGIKIEIELTIKNNKSHFSSDESGFIWPISFILLVTVAAMAHGVIHFVKNHRKGEDFDWGLFLVLIAIGFQVFYLFFELIHQIAYSSNGKGVFVLELFGELCEVLSQFTLGCFLLLISWGWTINYIEMDSFDVIIPLGVLMGVIHMMIMGLGKLTDNAHYKFHQYDGWPGYLIMFIRIGLFTYFTFGIRDSLKKASNKLKKFVNQLQIFGGLYFLAFPILLIFSWFMALYVRNVVITIGTLLIQTLSFVYIIYFNTNSKSGYYSNSMKGQTYLPGGQF